jgi:hypothetical protein
MVRSRIVLYPRMLTGLLPNEAFPLRAGFFLLPPL